MEQEKEFKVQLAFAQTQALKQARTAFSQVVTQAAATGTLQSGATIRRAAKRGAEILDAFVEETTTLIKDFTNELELPVQGLVETARLNVVQLPLQMIELPTVQRLGETIPHKRIKLVMLKLMDDSRQSAQMKLNRLKIGITGKPTMSKSLTHNHCQ